MNTPTPLVTTQPEKCRTCYTCVRECPAKAIRIAGGQAEILAERCVACGNCVKVCSQKAKKFVSSVAEVEAMLDGGSVPVVACLAPSFPAEFTNISYRYLVGMIKLLGFTHVTEVSFAADIVSLKYRELLRENPRRHYISTACPVLVSYVEKYHPRLIKNLAPVVSPMAAQAKIVRELYGAQSRMVFIGPCIAKKGEALSYGGNCAVLTFQELHELFRRRKISREHAFECEFDPPRPGKGMLYPIGRGLLQASGLPEDLLENRFLSADGTDDFVEVLHEVEGGEIEVSLLDLLCCKGCIMGPGMTRSNSRHNRQAQVSKYARTRMEHANDAEWERDIKRFSGLDYARTFSAQNVHAKVPSRKELQRTLSGMGKSTPADELNCGACGYHTCVEHAIAIYGGLAENEMCLPYTIDRLKQTAGELSLSYQQMRETREALLQSEKLASMGQLAAGIAHEVNNPLGVVLLYSHLLLEETPPESPFSRDLKMIAEQADRCKKIVGGLLNFARKNKVFFKETDIGALVGHCVGAITRPENVSLEIKCPAEKLSAEVDPDQLVQVIINLVTNAMEAMPGGGRVVISISGGQDRFAISVSDSGTGINPEHLKRIFQPFFTTKQMGKGTGLGLAVAYGIIKMHRGDITVDTNCDAAKGPTGTIFTVNIPVRRLDETKMQLETIS